MTMTEETRSLYERLNAFQFDEGRPMLPFHRRLARENGWTLPFTARAIAEYKKFLLLAVAAGHPVTPSDEVDQVWHLHLLYTRSYWERMCREVLGRALHHEPTVGGGDEARKFDAWYQRTRESYARIFACNPPADVWPDAAVRFGHARFVRVNAARHVVIPKFWRR